jgi:hypothetical protein
MTTVRRKQMLRVWNVFATLLTFLSTAVVSYSQDPQFNVNHTPYLQLGNATIGSAFDQIEILWQTKPAGSGAQDSFTVEYRQVGNSAWMNAGSPSTLNTGVEGRINHTREITGLSYNTNYEYRVTHTRAGNTVAIYQDMFKSRLAPGDNTPFSFAAYGDSAYNGFPGIIDNFRSVQNRINLSDANFALLLGDNAYSLGTHREYDARFDTSIVPEATQWNSSHVDFAAIGNHDNATNSGQPFRENYSNPLNGVITGQQLEENYSFEHGNVYFATIDTNFRHDATALDNQLDWLVADLNASTAQWKIVYGHHPIAGAPDKSENPSQEYYKKIVERLRAAEVDLFMQGHSHTYSWTYPLLGETGGVADFVNDTDRDYEKGAGLVQVVSGMGGRSIRSGTFTQFPFDAAGFSSSTTPASEYGFTLVDVTPRRLTVSYIAADDGAVIDSFSISEIVDFDLDSDVDGADFLKWQRGEVSNPPSAEDLALWEAQFGNTSTLSAAGSTIPEPSSLLLGALAAVGLLVIHSRARD